ncbi:MAG: hypothetical protein AAGE96_09105 [Cyanobacteria bacterium P01_G01_bin.19]
MKPTQDEINTIHQIKDLPVNLSINGLTLFMMIGQLQLALRHPSNKGQSADIIRDIVIDMQNQLQSRSPGIKQILDKGWHPEFDISTDEQVVEVHNAFTLYENADEEGNNLIMISNRPEDWGDPRWNYQFIKLEWKEDDTLYIQNAHIWTTAKHSFPKLLSRLGQAIGMVIEPGMPPELCDRSHLDIDDFWSEEWGELPPVFERNEDELMEFEL